MEEANSPNVIFQEIRKIGDFTGKICDMAMIFKANVSGVTFFHFCFCCCCCCCAPKSEKILPRFALQSAIWKVRFYWTPPICKAETK